jgi:ABC-type sugar transport system permease subunit
MTRITVPLMRPAFAFAFVTQAIGGLLIWDIIYVVFGAASIGVFGPGDSVLSLVPYIFKKAFMENFKLGLASAAGWLTFILVAIVSIFYLRIIGLGVSGEEE